MTCEVTSLAIAGYACSMPMCNWRNTAPAACSHGEQGKWLAFCFLVETNHGGDEIADDSKEPREMKKESLHAVKAKGLLRAVAAKLPRWQLLKLIRDR
jgi:hypothetical protein